jgi:hypothetical protein
MACAIQVVPAAGADALSPKGTPAMARKPNYPFERMERERLKAAKVAEKAKAKAEARERERAAGAPPSEDGPDEDS